MIKTTINRIASFFRPAVIDDESPVSTLRHGGNGRALSRQDRELRIHIGWTQENSVKRPVYVTENDLATHGSIFGRTGRGKSKFLQLLAREYLTHQRGFAIVDPKRDLIGDLLADIAARTRRLRCDAILKRVLLIEITPDSVPLLSAMHWHGGPTVDDPLTRNARAAFLAKEADVLIEIIHQMAGEPQEGAPRIKRLLRDVFVALATVRLEFGDAFVLLDPFHSRHDRVWQACRQSGLLPHEVQSDLQMIHELNRAQDVLTQIEGPLNRLRSLLSPLVRACFTDRLNGIEFARVLRDRQILLIDASESRFVSRFQARTVAGFIIHRLIEEAANEDRRDRDKRPPYALMIDEAAELIGPDIERNLRIGRSYKVPTFLFTQNVSAYRREDQDYRETVLNEPGITVAFQSKTPDDLLTDVLLHGKKIDYTKATREVVLHDGYDFVALPSVSRSLTNSHTNSRGGATSTTTEQTVTEGTGETNESGSGTSTEQRIDVSESNEFSEGASFSNSRSRSRSRSRERSQELGLTRTRGRETSEARGRDNFSSETTGTNRTDSETSGSHDSLGGSHTRAEETILRVSADGKGFERVSSDRLSSDNGRMIEKGSSYSIEESSQETTATTIRRMQTDSHSDSESASQSDRHGTTTQTGSEDSRSTVLDQRVSNSLSTGRSAAQSRHRTLRHAVRRDRQIGRTSGGSESRNWGAAIGVSDGKTLGVSIAPIAKYRTKIEELPQLKTDIETQRHKLLTELSTLGVAECLFRNDADSRTIRVRIRDVVSPFDTPDDYYRAIEIVKFKLRALHGYFHEPDLSPQAEADRLDAFVERLTADLRGGDVADADQADGNADGDDHDGEAFG